MPSSINKLSFLLSSKQFVKQMNFDPFDDDANDAKEYFFDQLGEGFVENSFLHLVIHNKTKADPFQTFVNSICHKLSISPIKLSELSETCRSPERQLILLILLHYYFVHDEKVAILKT